MKTFSSIILFLFTMTAMGDGVLQSVSGTTALAGSTIAGTVLTNNSTIGWTNTGNIQSATLNTSGAINVAGSQTNLGRLMIGSFGSAGLTNVNGTHLSTVRASDSGPCTLDVLELDITGSGAVPQTRQTYIDANGWHANGFDSFGINIVQSGLQANTNFIATTGYIIKSNTFPITSFAQLGNCGCVQWMSNATLYLICTNSINGNATTNKLGGL